MSITELQTITKKLFVSDFIDNLVFIVKREKYFVFCKFAITFRFLRY